MIYIIGSGPAGVSCASALLARGLAVTMLDVGVELEQEKQTLLDDLKFKWDKPTADKLKSQLDTNNPIKFTYGSKYPYSSVNDFLNITLDCNISCTPSFAKGGLSNVWGAYVAKYEDKDLTDWPITINQLNHYYSIIYSMLDVASSQLENCSANTYQSSKQAEYLYNNFQTNHSHLLQNYFTYGTAQLAAKFGNQINKNCIYCAACQHGCPLQLIYSAKDTLQKLFLDNNFTYIQNIIVTDLKEVDMNITIFAKHRLTHESCAFEGSQVFLACGSIISTQLILKSSNAIKTPVRFADSSHFMLPCLINKSVSQVSTEKLHTLCQLYLKLNNPAIAKDTIHLQLYTYMDYYQDYFKKLLKYSYPLLAILLKPILNRMIIIQGYLGPNESHQFDMFLQEDLSIQLSTFKNTKTKPTIQKLVSYLRKHHKHLGFYPIKWLLRISKIGKSFHFGGSLPMSHYPKQFETDIYGKPYGFKRLHVVDSTIFPSIPANSITPTIMANAYRIGAECSIL